MPSNWFSRWKMYEEIKKHFTQPRSGKVLLVGGDTHIKTFFSKGTQFILSDIPEGQKGKKQVESVDIHNMPYENDSFDYLIADQVIEHVKKPWVAAEEVRRVLKPGGFAILTSCLMNGIHWGPKDYWRFTPDGLRVLCEQFSKIEQCSGWGSWESLVRCQNKKDRQAVVKPGTPLYKLANAPNDNNLIHVWILAQK